MRILDRYVLREFLGYLALGISGFIVILVVVDRFEKISVFLDHRSPLGLVLRFYLYRTPEVVVLALPVSLLLATFLALGQLNKFGELTAMRAGGLSLVRIVALVLGVAGACVLLSLVIGEFLVPAATRARDQIFVMLAAFAFHAIHIAIDRRARACIFNMLPTMHDVHEFREKVLWFIGKRAEMPKSPPLGYAEKAEYLALVWGTMVMAVTGFVLWFSDWSLANLPKWASDVATVIHFYEAILASLAIVVWHFYFVIFDPLVYPLDTTFITGREAPGRALEGTAAVVEPKPKKGEAEKPKHA